MDHCLPARAERLHQHQPSAARRAEEGKALVADRTREKGSEESWLQPALTLESLHLLPSGSQAARGLAPALCQHAVPGLSQSSSGTTPFSSPRAPFFTLDLDQRLRPDPSHGSSEFYTRVTDGVIRLTARGHVAAGPRANTSHKPDSCARMLFCQGLFHYRGLLLWLRRLLPSP